MGIVYINPSASVSNLNWDGDMLIPTLRKINSVDQVGTIGSKLAGQMAMQYLLGGNNIGAGTFDTKNRWGTLIPPRYNGTVGQDLTIYSGSLYLAIGGGAPTGTMTYRVRQVAGDTDLGIIGTINANVLTGAFARYVFTPATAITITAAQFPVHLSLEFGLNAVNYPEVALDQSANDIWPMQAIALKYSSYIGVWTDVNPGCMAGDLVCRFAQT